MQVENDTQQRSRGSKWYWRNRERIRAKNKKQWATDPAYREAGKRRYREFCRKLRVVGIAKLGGQCACCGQTINEFLQFDHINNDGAKRRAAGERIHTLLSKLKKENWPRNYVRVLCANCNAAQGFYGFCPHEAMEHLYGRGGIVT